MNVLWLLLCSLVAQPDDVAVAAVDGHYCLYACLGALEFPVGAFADFQRNAPPPRAGRYSLDELRAIAESYQARTLRVDTSLDHLRERHDRGERFACIAPLQDRFVLIVDVQGDMVTIVDPPKKYAVARAALAPGWHRTALLIARDELMPETKLGRASPWGRIAWVAAAIVAVCAVAVLIVRRRRS